MISRSQTDDATGTSRRAETGGPARARRRAAVSADPVRDRATAVPRASRAVARRVGTGGTPAHPARAAARAHVPAVDVRRAVPATRVARVHQPTAPATTTARVATTGRVRLIGRSGRTVRRPRTVNVGPTGPGVPPIDQRGRVVPGRVSVRVATTGPGRVTVLVGMTGPARDRMHAVALPAGQDHRIESATPRPEPIGPTALPPAADRPIGGGRTTDRVVPGRTASGAATAPAAPRRRVCSVGLTSRRYPTAPTAASCPGRSAPSSAACRWSSPTSSPGTW